MFNLYHAIKIVDQKNKVKPKTDVPESRQTNFQDYKHAFELEN